MLPSASMGNPDGPGVFEPCHGSAPDIAGQDKANPLVRQTDRQTGRRTLTKKSRSHTQETNLRQDNEPVVIVFFFFHFNMRPLLSAVQARSRQSYTLQ